MSNLQFTYFGQRITLSWDRPDLDEQFQSLLLPTWNHPPAEGPEAVFRVESCGDQLMIHAPADEIERGNRPDVIESLERRIHFYLANHCRGVVFVHAGAVAWQNRVLLLPGSSYAGKSTLTHALVEAGAQYLTDEYAVVDTEGQVHPFPRPISLRPDGGSRVQPSNLCLTPLPVAAVISTKYEKQAFWSPIRVSSGQGVLKLLANTVTAREQAQLALTCLRVCVQGAICWEGDRGEAKDTASEILRALSRNR